MDLVCLVADREAFSQEIVGNAQDCIWLSSAM
jgi:hypothetical protein